MVSVVTVVMPAPISTPQLSLLSSADIKLFIHTTNIYWAFWICQELGKAANRNTPLGVLDNMELVDKIQVKQTIKQVSMIELVCVCVCVCLHYFRVAALRGWHLSRDYVVASVIYGCASAKVIENLLVCLRMRRKASVARAMSAQGGMVWDKVR